MGDLVRRGKLFERENYRYDFDREIYVNHHARKICWPGVYGDHEEAANRDGQVLYFHAEPHQQSQKALQASLSLARPDPTMAQDFVSLGLCAPLSTRPCLTQMRGHFWSQQHVAS